MLIIAAVDNFRHRHQLRRALSPPVCLSSLNSHLSSLSPLSVSSYYSSAMFVFLYYCITAACVLIVPTSSRFLVSFISFVSPEVVLVTYTSAYVSIRQHTSASSASSAPKSSSRPNAAKGSCAPVTHTQSVD